MTVQSQIRSTPIRPLALLPRDRDRLRVLFLAKHAFGDGTPDRTDGDHAVYHHELGQNLRRIGLDLRVANSFLGLLEAAPVDFIFTLLNRAGFTNSEMLAPTIAAWRTTPCLGASPILRGLGDDKYLMKLCARARGVTTPPAEIHRRGGLPPRAPDFAWSRLVVKPNASSASWGIAICETWPEARAHVDWLHAEGHDALVEAHVEGIELAVPVIGGADGQPVLLPVMKYSPPAGGAIRSYEEKRGLVAADEGLDCMAGHPLARHVEAESRRLLADVWPFDYGRFEFKVDPATGQSQFLELNMSCNLWSRKSVSRAWQSLGFGHDALVETILCHSMLRQGVVDAVAVKGDTDDQIYSPHPGGAPQGHPRPAGRDERCLA